MEKVSLKIFTDGGARGNPGPAAIGFVVKDDKDRTLVRIGKYIGKATNNVAEYRAVIEALKWLNAGVRSGKSRRVASRTLDLRSEWEAGREVRSGGVNKSAPRILHIDVFLDSQLVANQLNGIYKVKNAKLRSLVIKVKMLEGVLEQPIRYHPLSRPNLKEADAIVNQVLDRHLKRKV